MYWCCVVHSGTHRTSYAWNKSNAILIKKSVLSRDMARTMTLMWVFFVDSVLALFHPTIGMLPIGKLLLEHQGRFCLSHLGNTLLILNAIINVKWIKCPMAHISRVFCLCQVYLNCVNLVCTKHKFGLLILSIINALLLRKAIVGNIASVHLW